MADTLKNPFGGTVSDAITQKSLTDDFNYRAPVTPPKTPATPGSTASATNTSSTTGNTSSGTLTPSTSSYSRLNAADTASEQAAKTTLTTPYNADVAISDEQKLINARRSESQASIDAINQSFASQLEQEQALGKERVSSQNAILAASGLAGGSTAESSISGTKENNQMKVRDIQAKQAQALADTFLKIDQQAQKDSFTIHTQGIQDATTAINTIEGLNTAQKADQQTGQTNFADLAKNAKLSWDDFQKQSPDYAAKILQQTGYDQTEAAMKWNASKALAQQIKWEAPQKTADGFLFYGVDPVTGAVQTQTIKAPMGGNWDLKMSTDGTAIAINKDTGAIKQYSQGNWSGENDVSSAVAQVFPTGSTGGECGDFAHQLVNIPTLGDTVASKDAVVDSSGVSAADWKSNPKVGDCIIFNVGKTGHVAVVNKVLANGQVQVSESNLHLDGKVNNERVVDVNDPTIYGAVHGGLKGSLASATTDSGKPSLAQLKYQNSQETLEGKKIRNETQKALFATRLIGSQVAKDPVLQRFNAISALFPKIEAVQEDIKTNGVNQSNAAELLDAVTQMNTGGQAITEGQIGLTNQSKSIADQLSVLGQKISGSGGVIDSKIANDMVALANKTKSLFGDEYKKRIGSYNSRLSNTPLGDIRDYSPLTDITQLSSVMSGDYQKGLEQVNTAPSSDTSSTEDPAYQSYLDSLNASQ